RSDIPAWLASTMQKMLAKQPEARYQTPTDVAAELGQTLPSAVSPTSRSRGRRGLVALGGAVLVAVLIAVLLISALRSPKVVIKELPEFPGEQVAQPGDESLPFTAAVFSPKHKTILLVRKDGVLHLWEHAVGHLRALGTHPNILASVFAPDGRTL